VGQDKRRRKKEIRDLRRAEYEAALRRRRNARIAGAAVIVAALIGLALFTGSGGDDGDGGDEAADETPAAAACGAETPPAANPQQYERPQEVTQPGVDYRAVIATSCGEIALDLLEENAPRNVNNFVFLAQEGYYDGLTFHRVVNDFVIQTGDPNDQNGTPPDGPGYTVPDELPDQARDYVYGVVAMANVGAPDTAGSQFFITLSPQPHLDGAYTLLGWVAEGMDVADKIRPGDRIERVEVWTGR
jgi:peptidyl-prolyl cis-trans isomerase B (cyclophilin B)